MRATAGLWGLFLALAACGEGAAAPDEAPAGSIAATGPAPASQAAPPSETRQFRDWQATCDNGNACYAFGFAPDYEAGWVRIFMPPGPDAEPEVAFGLWGEETAGPATPALKVDGRAFPAGRSQASDTGAPVGEIRAGARAVVAAVAAARAIEVDAGDTMTISPNGASAALLWIDERQGRLGTTTALLRRGERPASGVPAAPALPELRPAEAADQTGFGDDKQALPASLRALPAVRACLAESEHSEWLLQNVMSARLDAAAELWAVPCGAGAYNILHQWYLTGPGGRDPRPAELPGSEGPRPAEAEDAGPDHETVNGGYAPGTRTLTAFAKGRGLGDCGTSQTWLWTGRRFELQAERSMGHCAGVPWDYWPTTWRTR
jgi:hypothetical protein